MRKNMEFEDLYNNSIILIGPSGAGKSDVAEELKKITGMKRKCIDDVSWELRKNGVDKKFRNRQEFNLFMLRSVMEDAKRSGEPGICDFGAGHSVYRDPKLFAEAKKLLGKFKNIVLLLPSADPNESLRIMNARSKARDISDNKFFLESPCNRELATITIYGNGRTQKEIAEAILEYIKNRDSKTEDKINE